MTISPHPTDFILCALHAVATCLVMRLQPAEDELFSELRVGGREANAVNNILKDVYDDYVKLPSEFEKVC